MFKSKLHRATVTHADVDYEGSVTMDTDLMALADIVPFEEVHVWNVTRGTRLTTYALAGDAGSRVVCINGAAAHLVGPGDVVIIATFTDVAEADVPSHSPTVVLLKPGNEVSIPAAVEVPGPGRR